MEQLIIFLEEPYRFAFAANKRRIIANNGVIIKDCDISRAAADLAAIIYEKRESQLLTRIARTEYASFSLAEQEFIRAKAQEMILADQRDDLPFRGLHRGAKTTESIRRVMFGSTSFSLEGFCRFRLCGYREYLHASILTAADELLAQEEEATYYSLLQRRLSSMQSKVKELHLIFISGMIYEICCRERDHILALEGGNADGGEDLLIGSLIDYAPERLVVTIAPDTPVLLINTISRIFDNRMIIQHSHIFSPQSFIDNNMQK